MNSSSDTTSSAAPNKTSGDGMDQASPGTSSSTLYLYTFLVTLILLCSVSAIIIARSYILRRRFRRQVEEALQNGHVLSPDGPGLVGLSSSMKSKLLGPPPKLWDVWVQPTVTKLSIDTEVANSGKFPWTEVRPLSAEILPQNPRIPRKPLLMSNNRANSNDSSILLSKAWMRKRTPQPSTSSVPTLNNAPETAETLANKNPHIQVVTLIAMPTPHRVRPNPPPRVESDSSRNVKGKWREERLDLTPITVGVTELTVILEDPDEATCSSNNES